MLENMLLHVLLGEYPELYAVAEQEDQLPEKEAQELRQILTDIFQEKMNKHRIK